MNGLVRRASQKSEALRYFLEHKRSLDLDELDEVVERIEAELTGTCFEDELDQIFDSIT